MNGTQCICKIWRISIRFDLFESKSFKSWKIWDNWHALIWRYKIFERSSFWSLLCCWDLRNFNWSLSNWRTKLWKNSLVVLSTLSQNALTIIFMKYDMNLIELNILCHLPKKLRKNQIWQFHHLCRVFRVSVSSLFTTFFWFKEIFLWLF
jgi:hypothetical protein